MNHLVRKILEENGVSHSQFGKDMGISHSYAVSLLNGSRAFTDNVYKKLVSLSYITGKDLEDITSEYFKVKFGGKQLKLVRYFLDLGRSFTFEPVSEPLKVTSQYQNEPVSFLKEDDIIKAATELLYKATNENCGFYTNYSFELKELDESLYATYKSIYDIENSVIDHIVDLPGRIEKISILSYWQCLKWGALRVTTNTYVDSDKWQIMPYYIACGDCVMLFSEDMSTGTFIVSKETAEYYISCHLKHKESSQPAVSTIHDEAQLLTGQDFVHPKYIKSLSTYISAMNFLDYDMLYRTTAENPEIVKQTLINAYINYYSHTKKLNRLYVYYTNDTLSHFMQTGRLYNVSEKYLHEFSPEDRCLALSNLIKDGMYSVIKESGADFFRGYDASSTDKSVVTHFILTPKWCNDYEIYMCIDKNKYRDLDEFTSALFTYIDEGHVYTKEESEFELRQLLTTTQYD